MKLDQVRTLRDNKYLVNKNLFENKPNGNSIKTDQEKKKRQLSRFIEFSKFQNIIFNPFKKYFLC